MLKLNIKSPHFQAQPGGTGVVNFPPKEFSIYEEAIRRYGDPRLAVSKYVTTGTENAIDGYFSLHYIGDPHRDKGLNDFWRLFDQVKKEHEERERRRPKTVEIGSLKVTLSLDSMERLVVTVEEPRKPITATEIKARKEISHFRPIFPDLAPGFFAPWPTPRAG